jgi:hypothetical protein
MNSILDLENCPHCNCNLDGGDIFETLRSLDAYKNYSDIEVQTLAQNYGWTENNKIHFSLLIGIDRKYQCPFTIMACTSTYPCDVSECNVRLVQTLRHRYQDSIGVGYSGHEKGLLPTTLLLPLVQQL